MWSVVNSLDPSLEIIPITQYTTSLSINFFIEKTTSCLTHIFEIGVEERESSLVIIPNHKPPKRNFIVLTIFDYQANLVVKGVQILSAMNETNADEKETIGFSWGS